jgi:glycosyltransferase involved in cell wall biosynthesis
MVGKTISLFADRVICVSNEIGRFSRKYEFINPKKIEVYPNGIDTKKLIKIKNHLLLRKKLGLNKNDFVVGIVGRLTKQKGHIFLIKAVELLQNKIPNLKVLVIGDGELEVSLKKEVIKRGLQNQFKFLGFRHDTQDLYSMMDVFCMPSLWEGLSIVLLEAMSTERLIVMSNLPNNIEVVKPNQEGIYFKKGNYVELADKVLDCYKYPQKTERIKKNARQKVTEKFDFKNNLKKIERAYLEVLTRK